MPRQDVRQIEQNLVRPCPSNEGKTDRTAGGCADRHCDLRQPAKARDAGQAHDAQAEGFEFLFGGGE